MTDYHKIGEEWFWECPNCPGHYWAAWHTHCSHCGKKKGPKVRKIKDVGKEEQKSSDRFAVFLLLLIAPFQLLFFVFGGIIDKPTYFLFLPVGTLALWELFYILLYKDRFLYYINKFKES